MTDTSTGTLTDFMSARLDEDEVLAREVLAGYESIRALNSEVRALIERERRAAQVEVVRAVAIRAERASTNVHVAADWLSGIADHIERGDWRP